MSKNIKELRATYEAARADLREALQKRLHEVIANFHTTAIGLPKVARASIGSDFGGVSIAIWDADGVRIRGEASQMLARELSKGDLLVETFSFADGNALTVQVGEPTGGLLRRINAQELVTDFGVDSWMLDRSDHSSVDFASRYLLIEANAHEAGSPKFYLTSVDSAEEARRTHIESGCVDDWEFVVVLDLDERCEVDVEVPA